MRKNNQDFIPFQSNQYAQYEENFIRDREGREFKVGDKIKYSDKAIKDKPMPNLTKQYVFQIISIHASRIHGIRFLLHCRTTVAANDVVKVHPDTPLAT